MATQRYISTSFWDDEWVQNLHPEAKLFYIYLLTNSLTNIAGIYKITDRRISFDTAISEEAIQAYWIEFGEDGKVIREGEWIIIPRWPKHQRVKERDNIRIGIDTILRELPEGIWQSAIRSGYSYEFLEGVGRECEAPSSPLQAPSKGHGRPSNYLDTDTDANRDRDSESDAPAREAPEPESHTFSNPPPKPEKPGHDIGLLIAAWNGIGLPEYRHLPTNIANLGQIMQELSVYSAEEIVGAMKNYEKILNSPDHDPFPTYPHLPSFLSKGVTVYFDGAKPLEQMRKKGTKPERVITPIAPSVCENGHEYRGEFCLACARQEKAERIAQEEIERAQAERILRIE
jgi:hypothetical protein